MFSKMNSCFSKSTDLIKMSTGYGCLSVVCLSVLISITHRQTSVLPKDIKTVCIASSRIPTSNNHKNKAPCQSLSQISEARQDWAWSGRGDRWEYQATGGAPVDKTVIVSLGKTLPPHCLV
ncbi:hypothetical protein NQD34_010119 [Periophthalmus magnuspinnatus]|nr:hypothetical protein NQD34_010119 [Periophthalmus magnuspinnatus]